jgi:hypothetical protein
VDIFASNKIQKNLQNGKASKRKRTRNGKKENNQKRIQIVERENVFQNTFFSQLLLQLLCRGDRLFSTERPNLYGE